MTTTTSRGSTVIGVFDDREDARDAIEALKDDGFTGDAISILAPDKQATHDIADDTGDLDTEQIARAMDKREGAIRALQMRALMSLRRVLERQGENGQVGA